MPLEHANTEAAFKNDIEAERAAGKPIKQAVAIAYEATGKDSAIRASGIVYRNKDSVLLLKRRDAGEMWALPGGKIEDGETPEQAARRESQEEIGYAPSGDIQQIDYSENPNVEFTTYLCDEIPISPVLNNEHSAYMWAKLDSLPIPLHPGVSATFRKPEFMERSSSMDDFPSARMEDQNGYITIENNPISRSGIFPYLGKSISKECIPDKIYYVLRPASEIEDAEAIESFKLLPFVDEHDMLGAEEKKLLPPEAKGIQGATGENIVFKNGVLYATLKIFSQTLLNMIRMGKRELSLGYWCKFVKQSGTFDGQFYEYVQTKLRGNHLALVDRGRNDVAVLDNHMVFDHFDLALDSEELKKMAYGKDDKGGENSAKGDQEAKDKAVKDNDEGKEGKPAGEGEEGGDKEMSMAEAHAMMQKIMPTIAKMNKLIEKHGKGGEDGEKTAEATDPAADNADFKPTTTPAKTGTGKGVQDEEDDMKKDAKDEDDKKDAMDSAIKGLDSRVSTFEKDGFKTIMREAAARDQLASKLSQFVGVFDHSEMNTSEVAAYGVSKLGIKCAKGQETAVLTGFLHDRKPATVGFSLDSAVSTGGRKGKYAERKASQA